SSNMQISSNYKAIGPALRVLQLNVEGLSAAKRTVISDLARRHNIDVVCLQETHISTDKYYYYYYYYYLASQHRPSFIHIGFQLPIVRSSNKLRWNFRKANWEKYSNTLEQSIIVIPSRNIPIDEAYRRFCMANFKAAGAAIPCGYRPVYIPCLNAECEALLKQYELSGDPDLADHVIESLDEARRARWEEAMESLDFTRSSWKSWNLIHRLGAAQQPPAQSRSVVTPNQLASHMLKVTKFPVEKEIRQQVRGEWRKYCWNNNTQHSPEPFTVSELDEILRRVKSGTAAGYDNISPELPKHLGNRACK
uniref:Endonuclease/exonuclease/phosphatase domain-containing protein n=1 Tax=Latimeria chalumnae TaxID=7897 RepID=H3BBV6_LATCH